MNIFNWFRSTPGTGANIDTRSEDQKKKDYSVVEAFAAANPVEWKEKPESAWRKFPVQDQNGSSSCVAQTMKKLLGVMYWLKHGSFVRFSATHIYQRRSNKPSGGMIGVEAFDIAMKGVTLEELVGSERMTDSQMDNATVETYHQEVGNVFKIGGHVGIPVGDIETVASVIQTTGKAVMVWFYFTSSEWSSSVPTIKTDLSGAGDARSLRHSVAAVDFTLYNGKKALIIEDSAHFGGLSRRIITEDFFAKRNFLARYPMNFTFGGGSDTIDSTKPKYRFRNRLVFIPLDSEGNIANLKLNEKQMTDVIALQNVLKYEGFFPTNLTSTGYYGSITAKAVLAFQKKYKLGTEKALEKLAGRQVGTKTLLMLNKLYSK